VSAPAGPPADVQRARLALQGAAAVLLDLDERLGVLDLDGAPLLDWCEVAGRLRALGPGLEELDAALVRPARALVAERLAQADEQIETLPPLS
jgi:hypothetical protein